MPRESSDQATKDHINKVMSLMNQKKKKNKNTNNNNKETSGKREKQGRQNNASNKN